MPQGHTAGLVWSPGQLSPGQARTRGQASSVQNPGQLSASLPQHRATLYPHGRDVSGEKAKECHYLLSLMPVRKAEASCRDLLCFRQLSWLLFFFSLLVLTCGMWDLSSHQGSNPCPLKWQHGVLTTGPPGNSHDLAFQTTSQPVPWATLFGVTLSLASVTKILALSCAEWQIKVEKALQAWGETRKREAETCVLQEISGGPSVTAEEDFPSWETGSQTSRSRQNRTQPDFRDKSGIWVF